MLMEFLLVKLGLAAVFQFLHGFIYTYVTGRPLEEPGQRDNRGENRSAQQDASKR